MSFRASLFENLRISRHEPVYRQITNRFRELILSGDLPVGCKLPSTQEIAAEVGSDPATVHTALRVLVKEGLITRQPRRGTFVRGTQEVLTQVGLFLSGSMRDSSSYQRSVFGAMEDLLRQSNLRYKVFIDPRPVKEQVDACPELLKSIERREIQGLIGLKMDRRSLQWLQKLPIPSAYHVSGNEAGVVAYDFEQLARMSLGQLRDQGCRSVALIAPHPVGEQDNFGGAAYALDFYQKITDSACDLGLTIRNEMIRIPSPSGLTFETGLGTDSARLFGYEQFKALWRLPERPDGLIVYPDSIVKGTILAMTELSASPHLSVVFHRNKHVNMLCPFPAAWVQSDETQVAAALLDQVRKQLRGEPTPAAKLSFSLIKHS